MWLEGPPRGRHLLHSIWRSSSPLKAWPLVVAKRHLRGIQLDELFQIQADGRLALTTTLSSSQHQPGASLTMLEMHLGHMFGIPYTPHTAYLSSFKASNARDARFGDRRVEIHQPDELQKLCSELGQEHMCETLGGWAGRCHPSYLSTRSLDHYIVLECSEYCSSSS